MPLPSAEVLPAFSFLLFLKFLSLKSSDTNIFGHFNFQTKSLSEIFRSSGKDIQFEYVFDFENFMHVEDSRRSLKWRHRSDQYLLNVSTLSFREKTCS